MKARKEAESLKQTLQELSTRQGDMPRSPRDLEHEFWTNFIPGARHWKTGKPIHLFQYQIDALNQIWSNQTSLLHWGRQCGKTLVVALYLAFMSRWKSNWQVIISSFGKAQSKVTIRYIKFLLMRHEDPAYQSNIEFASVKHLSFKNGTRIDSFGSGQTTRALASDIVVVDECQLLADDDYSAILPTKLVTKAKQILLGTTWSVDNFWFNWTTKPAEYGYAYSKMTSVAAVEPNGPISAKDLADLQRELGEARFSQECLLVPLSSVLRWFTQDLLERVFTTEPYSTGGLLDGSRILVGLDPAASSRDESVAYPLLLLPDGSIIDLPVLAWHNTPAPVQVEALKLFAMQYAAYDPVFVVDQTSAFGITFCDLLEAAGLQFVPFTFSSQSKAILYTRGKAKLEELPSVRLHDQKTKHQLSVYSFRESESVKGRFRFGQPSIPDDRADALMLALWGVVLDAQVDRSYPFVRGGHDPVSEYRRQGQSWSYASDM